MKKKYTLDDALSVIIKAARFYNENLNGKDFLIISKEQSDIKGYEISFKAANFMHFAGVKSSLSPRRFLSSALNGKLSTQNFEFKDAFLAQKKMNVLEQAVSLPYSQI